MLLFSPENETNTATGLRPACFRDEREHALLFVCIAALHASHLFQRSVIAGKNMSRVESHACPTGHGSFLLLLPFRGDQKWESEILLKEKQTIAHFLSNISLQPSLFFLTCSRPHLHLFFPPYSDMSADLKGNLIDPRAFPLLIPDEPWVWPEGFVPTDEQLAALRDCLEDQADGRSWPRENLLALFGMQVDPPPFSEKEANSSKVAAAAASVNPPPPEDPDPEPEESSSSKALTQPLFAKAGIGWSEKEAFALATAYLSQDALYGRHPAAKHHYYSMFPTIFSPEELARCEQEFPADYRPIGPSSSALKAYQECVKRKLTLEPYTKGPAALESHRRYWGHQWLIRGSPEALMPPPEPEPPIHPEGLLPRGHVAGVDPDSPFEDLTSAQAAYGLKNFDSYMGDFQTWTQCHPLLPKELVQNFRSYLNYMAFGQDFPDKVTRDRETLLQLLKTMQKHRRQSVAAAQKRPAPISGDTRASSFRRTDEQQRVATQGQQRLPVTTAAAVKRTTFTATKPPPHPSSSSGAAAAAAAATKRTPAAAAGSSSSTAQHTRAQAQQRQAQLEEGLRQADLQLRTRHSRTDRVEVPDEHLPAKYERDLADALSVVTSTTSRFREALAAVSKKQPSRPDVTGFQYRATGPSGETAEEAYEATRRAALEPLRGKADSTQPPASGDSLGEEDEEEAQKEREENPDFFAKEVKGMTPEETLAHTLYATHHGMHFSPHDFEDELTPSPPQDSVKSASSRSPPVAGSRTSGPVRLASTGTRTRVKGTPEDDPAYRYISGAMEDVNKRQAAKSGSTTRTARSVRLMPSPLPTPLPFGFRVPMLTGRSPTKIFRVRMLSSSHVHHERPSVTLSEPGSGITFGLDKFQKNSQVLPDEYVRYFVERMKLGSVNPDRWVSLFQMSMAQQDLADLVSNQVFSPNLSIPGQFVQVVQAFKEAASPTQLDQRAAKARHFQILKSPIETLELFYDRYLMSARSAYPLRTDFCEEEMDEVLRALEDDVQNLFARAPYIFAEPDEYVDVGTYPITSRLQFRSKLETIYNARDPQEEQAANAKRMKEEDALKSQKGTNKHELRHLSNGTKQIPLSFQQKNSVAISGDPYTPPERPDDVQDTFDRLKRKEKKIEHLADRSRSPSPAPQRKHKSTARKGYKELKPTSSGKTLHVRSSSRSSHRKPKRRRDSHSSSSDSSSSDDDDILHVNQVGRSICIGCCMPGHVERDCPRRDKNSKVAKYLNTGPSPYAKKADVEYINQHFNKKYSTADLRSENGDEQANKRLRFSVPPTTGAPTRTILRKARQVDLVSTEGTDFAVRQIGANGQDEITLALNLGGVEVPAALIDTGASCTLINEDLYQRHRHKWGKLKTNQKYHLESFDQRRIGILGTLNLRMYVSDPDNSLITYSKMVEILVTRDLGNHMLIGMDVLNLFFSNLVFSTGKLYIRADLIPDQTTHAIAARPDLRTGLRVRKHIEFLPGATRVVEVEFDHLIATSPRDPLLLLPKPCFDKEGYPLDLAFPSAVISLEICRIKGQWRMAIANPSSSTIVLPRGTEIGWVAIQPTGLPSERGAREQNLPATAFQLSRVDSEYGGATYDVVRKVVAQKGGTTTVSVQLFDRDASPQRGDSADSSSETAAAASRN